MPTIFEAIGLSMRAEQDWNMRMFVAGYHGAYLPIPPLRYRLGRAVHLSVMTARENLAVAIAPWLDPDVSE